MGGARSGADSMAGTSPWMDGDQTRVGQNIHSLTGLSIVFRVERTAC